MHAHGASRRQPDGRFRTTPAIEEDARPPPDPRIALGMALIDPRETRVAAYQRFPTIKTEPDIELPLASAWQFSVRESAMDFPKFGGSWLKG